MIAVEGGDAVEDGSRAANIKRRHMLLLMGCEPSTSCYSLFDAHLITLSSSLANTDLLNLLL